MGKTLGDAVKGVFGRGKSERKNDSSNNYNVGPVLERLEDRTLLSGVTPSDSMAADAYAVNDSAVVVNYDSSGDAKVEDPNALVVIDVPIMSGADVMYAIYGDYDATATSGVDNVSNLGFTVDGDSNDTNKYSMVFFKGDNPAGFVDRNEFVGSFLSGSIDVDPTTGNPATNPYELVVGEALNANTIWGLYDANGNGDFGSWSENAQGGVDMVFDDGEWTVDSAAYTFGGDLPYFTGTGMSGDLPSLDFDTSYAVGPVEGLPGDANDDGAVDEDDLEIFKSQFGLSGEGLSADFNDDGRCGLDDFAIMRSNFGATSAPEAAPVYGASSSMAMETKARPGREYNPVPVIETSIAVTSASTDVDVLASATPIYTDFPAPAAIPSFEDGSNSQTVLPSAGSLGSSLEDKVDRDSSSIVTSFSTDSSIQESDSTSTATMASATSSSSSVLNVIDSGADVMEAIYGDYDATATSGVDNVSNLGFTVDGDSNDTNKYSMVFFKGDNPAGFVDRNEFVGSFLSGSIDVDPTTSNPAVNPYELVVGEALNPGTIWGLYDANSDGDFGSWSLNGLGGTDITFDDGELTLDPAAFNFGGPLPHFTGTGMSGDLPSLDFDTSYAVPEPSTLSLLAIGGAALASKKRRK